MRGPGKRRITPKRASAVIPLTLTLSRRERGAGGSQTSFAGPPEPYFFGAMS
jgi:hypothetical protein